MPACVPTSTAPACAPSSATCPPPMPRPSCSPPAAPRSRAHELGARRGVAAALRRAKTGTCWQPPHARARLNIDRAGLRPDFRYMRSADAAAELPRRLPPRAAGRLSWGRGGGRCCAAPRQKRQPPAIAAGRMSPRAGVAGWLCCCAPKEAAASLPAAVRSRAREPTPGAWQGRCAAALPEQDVSAG